MNNVIQDKHRVTGEQQLWNYKWKYIYEKEWFFFIILKNLKNVESLKTHDLLIYSGYLTRIINPKLIKFCII